MEEEILNSVQNSALNLLNNLLNTFNGVLMEEDFSDSVGDAIANSEYTIGEYLTVFSVVTVVIFLIGIAIKVGLAFIPAKIAQHKGHSFGGFFALGLFFFIIGLIISLCISDKTVPATNYQSNSSADELKKYKDLLDSGAISQEEFDLKKKQLLIK